MDKVQLSCTIIHAITEHTRTEERLRESEEKYRTLFANMTEGFALGEPILDEQGRPVSYRYLVVNEAFYAQTGIPRGIQGLPIRDYLPHLEQYWIDRYCAVAITGRPDRVDAYNADTRRHYDVYVFSPSPGRFAILFRDITEQKQAEDELRTFKFFSDHSSESNVVVDSEGHIRYVNRRLCECLGYSGEEIYRLNFQEISPEFNTEITFSELVERAKDGNMPTFESSRRRKDGSTYPVEDSVTSLEVKGEWLIFVVSRDITERKRAEQVLKDSEQRLALALEASGAAVLELQTVLAAIPAAVLISNDPQCRDIRGNPAGCRIFSARADDNISYSVGTPDRAVDYKVFDPAGRELLANELPMQRAASEGRTVAGAEYRLQFHNGRQIWLYGQGTPLFTHDGAVRGAVGVFSDITERKQTEQQIRASEIRFHSTFEQLAVGLAHVSLEGLQLRVNAKYAAIVGYDHQTLEHMHFQEITHPDGLEKELENMASVLAGSISGYSMEKRYIRKDHTVIWCNLTVSLVRTTTGEPEYFVAVAEDIQARKEAEQALKDSEEKFRATFEHAPLGIAEITVDGRVIEVNAKLVEMLAYTKDELAHLTIADMTHPGDLEKSLSNFQKLAKGEAASYVMEKRYLRKDRSLVWVNVTASLVSTHGKPQYMILTVEDISTRKKIEEDLKRAMEASYYQANHDMLTGLANRASFHDRVKEALAYAKRDDHLVAIHMLDLDRFKSINDTLGHHIGDLLLKDVAKRIKSHIRASDLVARLGGDEFVVIQTHLAEPVAAGVLAGKLVDDLRRKHVLEDQEVRSGVSIGIAVFPNDADNPEELIKQADLALYEAKHRGRFNYQFYRQELGATALEAQRLDLELARALRENEFCLHYQPQFDLKSGRITGIEALLRWQHPTRGKLAASQFLLEAEHAKLMLPIGEWTLQTACRQHKAWVDAGLAVPLTLNLSAIQLRDPRLLDTLKRILEDTGLPASMLQVEMRESVLWDPKFSKNLLHQMKESGLRLALDDFGAEVTTLPSLDKFPLDALKPGRRLVKSLPSHPREAAILTAIIGVAHNLSIAVCADGVETDDQFTAVKDQGCDSAKGYWLSSPLDAQQMQQRIDVELTH